MWHVSPLSSLSRDGAPSSVGAAPIDDDDDDDDDAPAHNFKFWESSDEEEAAAATAAATAVAKGRIHPFEDGSDEEGSDEGEEEEDDDDDDDSDEAGESEGEGDAGASDDAGRDSPPRRAPLRYFETATAGDDRGGPSCYLCGGPHVANKCPDERCFVCLQRGHQSRSCPSKLEPGSRVLELRRLFHAPQASDADMAEVRCCVCGEYGHLDCSPWEQRPRNPSCFNCGRQGHTAAECGVRNGEAQGFWHSVIAGLGRNGGGAPRNAGRGGRQQQRDNAKQGRGGVTSNRRGPPPPHARLGGGGRGGIEKRRSNHGGRGGGGGRGARSHKRFN